MRDVITRIKPSAFFRPISVDKQSVRKLLVLGVLRLIKIANSDSELSFYDESTEYQLEDDGNDDRVLAQPGLLLLVQSVG